MAGKQAKTLSPEALRRALTKARCSPTPERDAVVILLSVRAGLRACEIARLDWSMVLDARGKVALSLELQDRAAKKRGGRRVPLHSELRVALKALRRGAGPDGPVIQSTRGGAMRPNSIVNWFVALYRDAGIDGCSSHSGRRTFITTAARQAHRVGASLRDVQLLAGHKSIETTQTYIDGDSDAQRRLVTRL
ncbi:MAG: site-specific integrase [Caulobacteraceae bacterium]